MIRTLIWLYRANPVRPHCDAAAGRHVKLCSLLMQQEHCMKISGA